MVNPLEFFAKLVYHYSFKIKTVNFAKLEIFETKPRKQRDG